MEISSSGQSVSSSEYSKSTSDCRTNDDHQTGNHLKCICISTTIIVATIGLVAGITVYQALSSAPSSDVRTDPATKLPADQPRICTTEACHRQMAHMVSAMDTEVVDPCEDFYQYTCNKWIANHSHWSGSVHAPKITKRTYMSAEMWEVLRAALEEQKPTDLQASSIVVQYVRKLYDECVDIRARRVQGLRPVRDLLQQIFGSKWPSQEQHPSRDWMHAFVGATLLDVQPIFRITFNRIPTNFNDSSKDFSIIPKITMPYHYLNQSKSILEQVIRNFQLMGVTEIDAQQMASAIVQLDRKLFENFPLPLKNNEYRQFSFDKLHSLTSINWTQLMNSIAGAAEVSIKYFDTDKVVTNHIAYVRAASEVITRTKQTTLKNYIAYMIIEKFRHLQLDQQENKQTSHNDLSDRCIELLENTGFNYALSRIQLDKLIQVDQIEFDHLERVKQQVSDLVHDLKLSFSQLLHENRWLDAATRDYAIEKLSAMGQDIAYPEWIWNSSKLDLLGYGLDQHMQQNITVRRGHFIESLIQWIKTMSAKRFQAVLLQENKMQDFLDHGAYQVKAAYALRRNTIMITNAILRPPTYHPDWPPPLEYGKLGFILSHEITHGFDSRGRHFDKHGNRHNWWSAESARHFTAQSQCFIDQYEAAKVADLDDVRLNGTQTLSENIADNAGIRAAYGALVRHLQHTGMGNQSALKGAYGTPYSIDQLFFMSFGKLYCRKYDLRYKADHIRTTVHSPARIRINLALGNFDQFARAWNCPRASAMNPEHKCRVW